MTIAIITTGGTIDKIYFDDLSTYQVGEPLIGQILASAKVGVPYRVHSLMQKDSLDLTPADRQTIRDTVSTCTEKRILITHGTDTMIETARHLAGIDQKVIVLTGAMQPAIMHISDAVFNVAAAFMAVQLLPEGVHIVINGRVFNPQHARKNREKHCFEDTI